MQVEVNLDENTRRLHGIYPAKLFQRPTKAADLVGRSWHGERAEAREKTEALPVWVAKSWVPFWGLVSS